MACLMCRDAKFCVSTMGVRIVQIGVVQSMCRVFGYVETQNFVSLRWASAIIICDFVSKNLHFFLSLRYIILRWFYIDYYNR